MSLTDNPNVADRPVFFDGQRLFADDLHGVGQFHRTLRELHNRSLHQPGIGSGLEVKAIAGDRNVVITPGYAIDGLGHEILNASNVTEAVPPVASDDAGEAVFFDLAVSYKDELEEAEVRRGVCAPGGVVRLREEPTFCWVRLKRGQDGELHPRDAKHAEDLIQCRKLRLARIEVKDCRIQSVPTSFRHDARPELLTYTGSGEQEFTLGDIPKALSDVEPTKLGDEDTSLLEALFNDTLPKMLVKQLTFGAGGNSDTNDRVGITWGKAKKIVFGVVNPGANAEPTSDGWKRFLEELDIYVVPLRVRVNTSSARFSRTPCYSVSFRLPATDIVGAASQTQPIRQAIAKMFLAAFTTIVKPTATSFELQLLYPASGSKEKLKALEEVASTEEERRTARETLKTFVHKQLDFTRKKLSTDLLNLTVLWMGIE